MIDFKRLDYLFETIDGFGPMHIVVEDGNVSDGNLNFVEKEILAEGHSSLEWELLGRLRLLSEEDRERYIGGERW